MFNKLFLVSIFDKVIWFSDISIYFILCKKRAQYASYLNISLSAPIFLDGYLYIRILFFLENYYWDFNLWGFVIT